MSVAVVTAPAPLVTAAEARLWAPVLAGDADARIEALLLVAQTAIEPPNGWVGRALGLQTLEARFSRFEAGSLQTMGARSLQSVALGLPLPCPPVRELVSVTYRDLAGADRTIPLAELRLLGIGTAAGSVVPARGRSWPQAEDDAESVRVQFKAGYDRADPAVQPARHAIVLAATHLRSLTTQDLALRSVDVPGVSNRSWTVSEVAEKLIRSTVDALLQPLRVYR